MRCLHIKVGRFLCNYWDDEQTEVIDGVCHLKGINPILTEGKYVVMDVDTLEQIAHLKMAQRDSENNPDAV